MNILAIINFKKEDFQKPISAVFFAIFNLFHKLTDILIFTEEDRKLAGIYLGYEKGDK